MAYVAFGTVTGSIASSFMHAPAELVYVLLAVGFACGVTWVFTSKELSSIGDF